MFFFIFITKKLIPMDFFFDFAHVIDFTGCFRPLKSRFFSKFIISFCNFCWVTICSIQICDCTPFKVFIIVSILNNNQSFYWMV